MKKKIFLSVFTFVLGIAAFLGVTDKKPTHALFILLDFGQSEEIRLDCLGNTTGNTPLGAITSTLLPALYEQIGPLLVSTSLLRKIIQSKQIFQDCLNLDFDQLQKKYGKQKITCSPSLKIFQQHCQYAHRMYTRISKDIAKKAKSGSLDELEELFMHFLDTDVYSQKQAPQTLQLYCSSDQSLTKNYHRELQIYCLCAYAPLDTTHYYFKKVSHELTLLVRKDTLHSCAYQKNLVTLTPAEKELGLKVNHLEDVATISDFLIDKPITYDIQLVSHLQKLFVTQKEGSTAVWHLYLTGHGLPPFKERNQICQLTKIISHYTKQLTQNSSAQEKFRSKKKLALLERKLESCNKKLNNLPRTHESLICSMPTDEFMCALDFFEHSLETASAVYTSCFAGGTHLQEPYKNRAYSYNIIVGSVSDVTALQISPLLMLPPYNKRHEKNICYVEGLTKNSLDLKKKQLVPYIAMSFTTYLKQMMRSKPDYHTALYALHPYTEPNGALKEGFLENVAHYRPARSKKFTVLAKPPHFVTVPPSHETITGDVAFFSHATYGTLELPKKMVPCVSLIPGSACHTVETIQAPSQELSSVVSGFLVLPTLSSTKIFWIKKLVCTNEREQEQTLYDVIIVRNALTTDMITHSVSSGLYFSDATGKMWFSPIDRTVLPAKEIPDQKAHGELLALIA